MSEYERGSLMTTYGGIDDVYPDPGLVIVTDVEMCPVPTIIVENPT